MNSVDSGDSGRSFSGLYTGVLVCEAVCVLLLWFFSRYFGR
jgi:hypothetical protein